MVGRWTGDPSRDKHWPYESYGSEKDFKNFKT